MKPITYFTDFPFEIQRRYEALRLHFMENISIQEVAKMMSLSPSYLLKEKSKLSKCLSEGIDPFFCDKKTGPKTCRKTDSIVEHVVELRKQNYSIIDIKASLDALGKMKVSLGYQEELISKKLIWRFQAKSKPHVLQNGL
jgi:hypothetical protein